MARVKELTGGLGAHSVIEAVGTQESTMQAIGSTRPGGHVGYVGVARGNLRRTYKWPPPDAPECP